MATVTPVITTVSRGVYKAVWSGLGVTSADDVGAAVHIPGGYSDITIQVIGTFAGSTCAIQGSNDDGTTYAGLNDNRGEGNALSFTAADVRKSNETPQQLRPVLTSGSSSNVSVIAIIRKGR